MTSSERRVSRGEVKSIELPADLVAADHDDRLWRHEAPLSQLGDSRTNRQACHRLNGICTIELQQKSRRHTKLGGFSFSLTASQHHNRSGLSSEVTTVSRLYRRGNLAGWQEISSHCPGSFPSQNIASGAHKNCGSSALSPGTVECRSFPPRRAS